MLKFGLQDDTNEIVLDIFKAYPQIEEVILFGSRALNTFKAASDIDFAIKGKSTRSILAALMDDFEESDLIYEVDLVDYASITSEKLLEHIDRRGIIFYRKGWIDTSLGYLVTIKYGKDHKHLADGDYPLYGSGGIMRYVEKPLYSKESILIPRKGTLTNLFYVNEAFWSVDTIFYTEIDNEKVIPLFLFYKLKTIDLAGMNVGSAVPSLTTKVLNPLELSIPPLPEQKAIADMLSSFDKKIELLREQNKTLETLAQTIFKEWFVSFNYPNASGVMVDSELGKIPQGWQVGKLGEEFDITIGRTPPRKEQHWFSKVPTGKKWSSIKDIVNSGTYLFETSEYITGEAISKFNIPIIPEDTVILSFKMTVGKLAITTEDMLSNEAIAHMKIKSDSYMISEYIYLFLHGLDFNSLGSTSSIVTAINSTMIKQIQLLIPDEVIIKSFKGLIKPTFEKIKNNTSQIQSLSKTRDTLLPKLMSGQVRTDSGGSS